MEQPAKKPTTVTKNYNIERDALIETFLQNNCSTGFERIKIPGDASFRHYERIICSGKEFILMDSPPGKEDVRPFIKVDEILRGMGLSAPEILARDIENGFLLLEDFGDKKYNHLFKTQPENEEYLYKMAIEVLAEIYNKRQKFDLAECSREKLLSEAMLLIDWYLPLFEPDVDTDKAIRDYNDLMNMSLDRLKFPNDVIIMRDYHADNLMLLEERDGYRKVGLLDFQDALMGNIAYDLVSLLEDARRDVPKDIQDKMIEYLLQKTGLEKRREDFLNDYHILGAQRNLKILGIFARLKMRDGKDNYLQFIPRVKAYLKQDLQHPALKELKKFLEGTCKL